jgi:hypothetical protein
LEFRTPVNPWKVQPEYQDDFDKIKTLEVELFQGMVMFIPAYWWYSIKFITAETSVCSFKYRTHMNTISIAPQLCLNLLQNMNTKRDTLEKCAHIKTHFQETVESVAPPTAAPMAAPTVEYTPSLEDQYLPKSLRGTNSNPYSIMNAVGGDSVLNATHHINGSVPAPLETADHQTTEVATDTPKEVIIPASV